MNTSDTDTQQEEQALYPIRTVSDLTGVNAITLRAWERRHGLFTPVRKASGHRLYKQEHIDLITRVVGLLDRGMRIGQVKNHLDSEDSKSGTHKKVSNFWTAYRDRLIANVIQFNEAGLEATYGEALSLYPADQVTENLLTPTLKELGRRWSSDEGSVAEEHFFACYVRNKLGARIHHQKRSQSAPRILLACLPGERHEIGLLLFGLAASDSGYEVVLLGADIPLEELPPVVQKTGSKALILSGFMKPDASMLANDLPALTQQLQVPVILGGQASVEAHDALKHSSVHLLGTDLKSGLQRVTKLVPPVMHIP